MSRRSAYVVIGFVVAALVGVALMAIPSSPLHREATLGLDLQGGLEVTLQPTAKTLTDQEIEAIAAKIVAAVTKATGGMIRS
jgi:preprotein translocase subunit SecD